MRLLPNLYFLRFLLAMFVVISHLRLVSEENGLPYYEMMVIFYRGTMSVYYFFTLSGFLIIRLIYLELQTGNNFSVLQFYSRRIRRLYPVYYLVLIIGLLMYHVIYPLLNIHGDFHYKVSALIVDYIFFIPNIFIRVHPDVGLILYILWSIGVEEQFYLGIPWLLLLFKKNTLLLLGLLAVLCLAILFFYARLYVFHNSYYYFLGGGFMAVLNLRYKFRLFQSLAFHLLVYTLFLLSFFTGIFKFENFFLFHVFNFFVSALLIGLIADYPKFRIKTPMINYLGQISYGIYMYHPIVMTILMLIVNKTHLYLHIGHLSYMLLFALFAVSFTLGVAHFSFRYFERLFYRSRYKMQGLPS